jgi:hypothetical protein
VDIVFIEQAIPVLVAALLVAGAIGKYRALRRAADRQGVYARELYGAVERNDPDEVRRLTAGRLVPDIFRDNGLTGESPLLLAVRLGHFEVALALISRGALVDWRAREDLDSHLREEEERRRRALIALAERRDDRGVLADFDQPISLRGGWLGFVLPGDRGDQPQRLEYWNDRVRAVRQLIKIGTDPARTCEVDELPRREVDVSIAVFRLRELTALVPSSDQWGDLDSSTWRWTDADRAVYLGRWLREDQLVVFCKALVRAGLDLSSETDRGVREHRCRAFLQVAIKLGVPGSEEVLRALFTVFGTDEIALDYLDSGSATLRHAGLAWVSFWDTAVVGGRRGSATWGMM